MNCRRPCSPRVVRRPGRRPAYYIVCCMGSSSAHTRDTCDTFHTFVFRHSRFLSLLHGRATATRRGLRGSSTAVPVPCISERSLRATTMRFPGRGAQMIVCTYDVCRVVPNWRTQHEIQNQYRIPIEHRWQISENRARPPASGRAVNVGVTSFEPRARSHARACSVSG